MIHIHGTGTLLGLHQKKMSVGRNCRAHGAIGRQTKKGSQTTGNWRTQAMTLMLLMGDVDDRGLFLP